MWRQAQGAVNRGVDTACYTVFSGHVSQVTPNHSNLNVSDEWIFSLELCLIDGEVNILDSRVTRTPIYGMPFLHNCRPVLSYPQSKPLIHSY